MADFRLSSVAPTGDAGHRVADLGEEVEVAERVAGLALGDRAEQGGHVGVALDVGLLGEVEVAAVGLALAGERLLEVVVGLGAVEVRHGGYISWWSVHPGKGFRAALLPGRLWPDRLWPDRLWPGRCGPALGAAAPEDDLGVAQLEALPVVGRDVQAGEGSGQVADLAAGGAHQMVVVIDVGVEAARAGPEVEVAQLAHLGQVVEGLVHRLAATGWAWPARPRRRWPRP